MGLADAPGEAEKARVVAEAVLLFVTSYGPTTPPSDGRPAC